MPECTTNEKKETPQSKFDKKNMAIVKGKYKKEFVIKFKNACETLQISQSSVIRKAMNDTIKKTSKENSKKDT